MAERARKRKGMATRSGMVSAQRTPAKRTGLARVRAMEKGTVMEREIPLAKLTPMGKGTLTAKAPLSVSIQPKGSIK